MDIALIFDMDGLLIDSEPLWCQAEVEIFNGLGVPLTTELSKRTKGLRQDEVVQYWYSRFPWTGISLTEVEELVISRMEQLIATVAQPMPGALETIRLCKGMNLPLGLASSSPMSLVKVSLKRLGLENSFDAVHSAEKEEFGKPHPAVYLKTAQYLGVPPTKCVAFEDSLPGLISAKAARMRCIVVSDPEERDDTRFALTDRMLNSLEEIHFSFLEEFLKE